MSENTPGLEKQILKQTEKIERAEDQILQEEKKILAAEKEIIKSGLQTTSLPILRSVLVKKISRHKLLFALVATIGMVLIWRGTWHTVDELPILNISLVSLLVGVLVLWFLKKYTDLH